jgi:hypothetical protein
MSGLGLILGGLLAAIALVVWFMWHKRMSGEEFGLLPKARDREERDSLEEFVAAYRRGEVSLKEEASPPHAPAAPAVAATADPPPERREPALPARRDPFLSGATKLAYYVCKSGLRDHHVFAHVRMQSLCSGKLDPQLAESEISLLVCNAGLSIIAAIDVIGSEPASTDAAKAETLRSLGIRYLRLSAKSLPRPEEIGTLLYRM